MYKLAEIIRDKSIESIIEKLLFLLGILLIPALLWFRDYLFSILKYIPKEFLLISILLLLPLLLLSVSFIIRLRKKIKNELTQALGVYWDKNLNAYCPSCKKLLGNYAFYDAGSKFKPGFKCINCKDVIRMSDGKNIFLSIEEAKEIVKNLFQR